MRRTLFILVPAAVAVAATAAIAAFSLGWAHDRPGMRVALESTAGLVAAVAAYLAAGRFHRSARASDLVLGVALAVLAASNLFFGAIPASLEQTLPLLTWCGVTGHVLGAVLLAVAAWMPDRLMRRADRDMVLVFGTAGFFLAALTLGLVAAESYLPMGIETRPTSDPAFVSLESHPLVLGSHVLGMAAFAFASLGFARKAIRNDDAMLRWFATAALFGAFARFHYALYPSLYSRWLYSGDVFRLAFYALLLGGALREIAGYWRNLVRAAVLEERRRVARDLHDGVAQELAFILRRSRRLARTGPEDAAVIAASAERALDDSRRAIAALTRPVDEPLEVALAEAAEDVAARTGTRLELDLAEGINVHPAVREALIRIAAEAIGNAARHADAQRVRLELASGSPIRLCVVDDGCGFDPDGVQTTRTSGFGLTSMRERAAGIGAHLAIVSRPGDGTRIEVTLT